jgi:hypothetical protein
MALTWETVARRPPARRWPLPLGWLLLALPLAPRWPSPLPLTGGEWPLAYRASVMSRVANTLPATEMRSWELLTSQCPSFRPEILRIHRE